MHVINLFPSPQAVLSATREDLLKPLKPARQSSQWSERKVDKLLAAARESLPDTSSQQFNIRVLKHNIGLLNTLQNIMGDVRNQMNSWAKLSPHYELLLSIVV
ncbi:MAG: hypothetical protein ACOYVD_16320 [Bacillota bacterium]